MFGTHETQGVFIDFTHVSAAAQRFFSGRYFCSCSARNCAFSAAFASCSCVVSGNTPQSVAPVKTIRCAAAYSRYRSTSVQMQTAVCVVGGWHHLLQALLQGGVLSSRPLQLGGQQPAPRFGVHLQEPCRLLSETRLDIVCIRTFATTKSTSDTQQVGKPTAEP